MNRKIKNKISDEQKIVLGERIRALRENTGLKLHEFAEPLSIQGTTVSNYENGNAAASPAIVKELEQIYLMNRNWYETGQGPMLLDRSAKITMLIDRREFDLIERWRRMDQAEQDALEVLLKMKKR